MSNTETDERIICTSCEYRYPRSTASCPMCGKAAPAIAPLLPFSALPDGFKGADCESQPSSSDSPRPPKPVFRRVIPAVVVLIVLMVVSSVFYEAHKGSLRKESASASELAARSEQPQIEIAGERHVTHNPVRGVHVVDAKLGTAQPIDAVKEDDPADLWKAVKRGNVRAEVALANLYMEGKSVPQNCGQAQTLLHAASMKGSQAADTVLKSSYRERCE